MHPLAPTSHLANPTYIRAELKAKRRETENENENRSKQK
jgi:hypothetical protein